MVSHKGGFRALTSECRTKRVACGAGAGNAAQGVTREPQSGMFGGGGWATYCGLSRVEHDGGADSLLHCPRRTRVRSTTTVFASIVTGNPSRPRGGAPKTASPVRR